MAIRDRGQIARRPMLLMTGRTVSRGNEPRNMVGRRLMARTTGLVWHRVIRGVEGRQTQSGLPGLLVTRGAVISKRGVPRRNRRRLVDRVSPQEINARKHGDGKH